MDLDSKIRHLLQQCDFLLASKIAKEVGLTSKKDVNPILYKLAKAGVLRKSTDTPPKWSAAHPTTRGKQMRKEREEKPVPDTSPKWSAHPTTRHEQMRKEGEEEPVPVLRSYQQWFVRQCLQPGNCIVVLPTGAGKTLIAFELMKQALTRHATARMVFLCPTVVLTQQQHTSFQRYASAQRELVNRSPSVAIAAGSQGNANTFFNPGVVFATPQKFLTHLNAVGSNRGFGGLSLLVMDECHHAGVTDRNEGDLGDLLNTLNHLAVQNTHDCLDELRRQSTHPYAVICEEYRATAGGMRPKVIGLTASPGVLDAISGLAQTLLARPLTLPVSASSLTEELNATCSLTKTTAHLVDDNGLKDALRWLKGRIKTSKKLRAERVACHALFRVIGFGSFLTSVAGQRLVGDKAKLATKLCQQIASYLTEPGITMSPMFGKLTTLLEMEQKKRGSDFRAIIFVSTIDLALVLPHALNGDQFQTVALTGQSEMTHYQQKCVMGRFRRGECNVLVATSVAEEGLDIQRCSLVVRTEAPQTIIQNIQTRGRARYHGADYVILCLDKREQERVDCLKQTEQQAQLDLQAIAHGSLPFHPAVNNWDCISASSASAALPASSSSSAFRKEKKDFKSGVILVWHHTQPGDSPRYKTTPTGPSHSPCWTSVLRLGTLEFHGGPAQRKKDSEQMAAQHALKNLGANIEWNVDGAALKLVQ